MCAACGLKACICMKYEAKRQRKTLALGESESGAPRCHFQGTRRDDLVAFAFTRYNCFITFLPCTLLQSSR